MANKLWTVCIFILVVEIAERLCYYSISGSQRNFLEDVTLNPMQNGQAASINSVFTMLSYLSCFLGGYLADQWLGRYKTILIFATCYFLGAVMVAISATQDAVAQPWAIPLYLAGCLVFISIGTGAIKPNVMTFGAAQYDETDPVERAQQKTFFSYFYLMINVGAGVSYGFLVSLATAGSNAPNSDGIGGHYGKGFFKCYVIAAAAMGFAVLCFLAGTCRYKKEPPAVHKPMISVISKYLCRSATKSPRGMAAVVGWLLIPIYMALNLVGSIIGSLDLTTVCLGLCVVSCICLVFGHMKNDWMTEFTEEITGAGVTLADAKKTCSLVPQLLLINIGFNIPYNAMNIAYPLLACQMDVRLPWNKSEQLNGAFTNLGDCFAIIIGVPIIESLVYPCIEKRRGSAIPRKAKYIIGFLLVCFANLTAIAIEQVRAGTALIPADNGGLSQCASAGALMSNISCFWAFIPMFLTGIGEILVNPVVYEFAFAAAPNSLLSIVQAFNLVVAGSFSNCITGPLGELFVPVDLNFGTSINVTFILNIVIGLLCLVAYMFVEKYDECEPEDTSLKKEEVEQPLAADVEEQ